MTKAFGHCQLVALPVGNLAGTASWQLGWLDQGPDRLQPFSLPLPQVYGSHQRSCVGGPKETVSLPKYC